MSGRPKTQKDYATSEDDKCYRDECWLLNGHDGLHSYHPVVLPTSTGSGDQS